MAQIQIVSVDAGNGGTNGMILKADGTTKTDYFPSVRAAATGDSLGLSKGMELQYSYVDWRGLRYVVGDDVVKVTRRNLERHQGINRYGNEMQRFLVANSLARLGIKDGDVDLTLFAPPGLYTKVRKQMHDWFVAEPACIHLKGEKKPRVWHYRHVEIVPEGIGAAAAILFDEHLQPTYEDVFDGDVLVLDGGIYTLDAVRFSGGDFNPETLDHATWEQSGLSAHVLQPILRIVHQHSPDFELVTVDDIDIALRAKDKVLKVAGQSIDLKPSIDKFAENYAGWVANNVIDSHFAGLRGVKTAILVGGFADLVAPHLKAWYSGKIFDYKKHPATRKIHPVYWNVLGGLRLAQLRQSQR